MKKNLFITLGLALGLGVGVAAGIGANREFRGAKAATGDITGVWLKGSFNSWGTTDPLTLDGSGNYSLSKKLTKDDEFKIYITGDSVDEKWVGYDWGTSVKYDAEFVGEGDGGNYKALTSFTLKFTVKPTFYTNWGSDVSIDLNETRTVQFEDTTGAIFAETENLTPESNQFSGLITTTVANSKFRIKDTIGTTTNYYATKEDGVTVATEVTVETKQYFNIASTGTYSVYFKKDTHKCWIALAETSDVAYMYANFFKNNVGCDSEYGLDAPTGWGTCATRYAALSDDVKNFIYAADTHWTLNDDLYNMIQTYNWALNHNPHRASMAHFIVNASGTERAVPAGSTMPLMVVSTNPSNATIIIIVVSSLVLVSVGGFFLLRKKREN